MNNDIISAEESILDVLDIAKYSVNNYERLAEIYSQKLQSELEKNDLDGVEKVMENMDKLDKRLESALKIINKRSKYMKNQIKL